MNSYRGEHMDITDVTEDVTIKIAMFVTFMSLFD